MFVKSCAVSCEMFSSTLDLDPVGALSVPLPCSPLLMLRHPWRHFRTAGPGISEVHALFWETRLLAFLKLQLSLKAI